MPTRAEQRRLVWSGKKRKTTGGLSRDDLTLNRHGRIVSKRKSMAASKSNNLGDWLRTKGNKFGDVPAKARKGTNGKPKVGKPVPKKVVPKKVAPKKVAPKKVVPKKPAYKKVKSAMLKPKKKLSSKGTVVALKKKAEKGAAKNSKAGPPLSSIHVAEKPKKADSSAAFKPTKEMEDWLDF